MERHRPRHARLQLGDRLLGQESRRGPPATSDLEAARSESVAARAQSAEASAEGDLAATKENIAIT